jgi:hypothetical protein
VQAAGTKRSIFMTVSSYCKIRSPSNTHSNDDDDDDDDDDDIQMPEAKFAIAKQ